MIIDVHVKNFRSFANSSVELGPLTVLVGRNGVGKSTFLDVLRFVRDALRLGLDSAITQRHGITALRRWAPQGRPFDVEISLSVKTDTFWGDYSFVIGSGQQGEYKVKRESCSAGRGDPFHADESKTESFEIRDGKWAQPPIPSLFSEVTGRPRTEIRVESTALALPTVSIFTPSLSRFHHFLSRTSFYTIFPNTLREPQKPSNEDMLGDHGENLASVLRQVKKQGKWFTDLVSALDRVVEGVSDIRVRQVGGFLVTELKHKTTGERSPWFELAQESDGTLRMLGLLVALYQDAPATLIGIEEPELTMHPGALGVLSDVLREAAQRRQVLITTQSPDLVARFGADELRVVERSNGISHIGPVDETQREAINEQLFSAGDLLRIEGLRSTHVMDVVGADA